MEIELLLSRQNYRAGTPVVGSVRIHRPTSTTRTANDTTARAAANSTSNDTNDSSNNVHIRDTIQSARLYLAGRAHLGGSSTKKSRWRSSLEIAKLLKLYGQEQDNATNNGGGGGHACLKLACLMEQNYWKNDHWGGESATGSSAVSTASEAVVSKSSRSRLVPLPTIMHIEQAERVAVQSCLFPNNNSPSILKSTTLGSSEQDDNNNNNNNSNNNDDEDDDANNNIPPLSDCSNMDLPTPQENNVICFYMTNVLELLNVKERSITDNNDGAADDKNNSNDRGRGKYYEDMYPYHPLQLPDWNVLTNVLKGNNADAAVGSDEDNDLSVEEEGKYDESSSSGEENDEDSSSSSSSSSTNENDSSDNSDSEEESNHEEEESESDSKVNATTPTKTKTKTKTTIEHNADASITTEQSTKEINPTLAWEKIMSSAKSSKSLAAATAAEVGAAKSSAATASLSSATSATISAASTTTKSIERDQIALSFRAMLPNDVPPTMAAECVKYFYSAVLVVTSTSGELYVTQCPFTVLTSKSYHSKPTNTNNPHHNSHHHSQSTRVHIGDLHAIAHSSGLPLYLSSTDASGAIPSQLIVNANPPTCHIVSRLTAEQRTSTHIINDGKGGLCAWMTLVGIGGPLVPGMRVGIRVKFPNFDVDGYYSDANGGEYGKEEEAENDGGMGGYSAIIPCHRVCCALVGEEYAICEGVANSSSTSSSSSSGAVSSKRTKTRSYVFDSSYEMVDYGFTDSISLGLVLPLDCPVTVKTDLVEVAVTLKVEFTVDRTAILRRNRRNHGGEGEEVAHEGDGTTGGSGEMGVIRLDLPCEVVHSGGGLDDDPEDGDDKHDRQLSSICSVRQYWKDNMPSVSAGDDFDCSDIQNDLKMLSLRMIQNFD